MIKRLIQRLYQWFNETFKGWKYSTLGDIENKYRYANKKTLIAEITNLAGQINGNAGVIDKEFEAGLRNKGKKLLRKALLLLHLAYTEKLQGYKNIKRTGEK